MNAAPFRVLITDRDAVPDGELAARIARAASLPPDDRARFFVILRDRPLPGRVLLERARWLRERTCEAGARLSTNDRLDLALAVGADGVHLGRTSVSVADARALLGPGAFISVACHDVDDLRRAARDGADLALLSPIFASPGKGPPLGLGALAAAVAAVPGLPVVALGGIDAENAAACLVAGAAGVAAIRADLTGALSSH